MSEFLKEYKFSLCYRESNVEGNKIFKLFLTKEKTHQKTIYFSLSFFHPRVLGHGSIISVSHDEEELCKCIPFVAITTYKSEPQFA